MRATTYPNFWQILQEAQTGLNSKKVDIIVDISNGLARTFVPQEWRKRIFDVINGLGHPCVERTRQAVAAKFIWPNMRLDGTNWARNCLNYQRAKIHRNTAPLIGNFEVPN